MAKEKSSLKEIVINVLMLAAAGGILFWRVNDCKQKERAAVERAETDRKEAEQHAQQRQTKCLETVPESMRDACMQCTCRACASEVESCAIDPLCRTMSPAALLRDAGAEEESTSQLLYEARATCMAKNCMKDCANH